jgi:hypothetical protein
MAGLMAELVTDRFTVAVFQDAEWADRGIDALVRHGFTPQTLSLIARVSPEAEALVERLFGIEPPRLEVKNLGEAFAHGPLVAALDGQGGELATFGIAATARHAGFQAHDGVIFERLTVRGGVLVAVTSEARAAEALTTFHAFGGGNAAIGAWSGRV